MEQNLPFNKKLVGKFLSVGAENIVYCYNNNKEVIKFPLIVSLRYLWDSERYCVELKNGYEVLKKYLFQSISQSRIHFYKTGKKTKYAIIEPFINGKALTKLDLENEFIKNQFLKIVIAKKEMEEKEQLFLDLFGVWGLFFIGEKQVSNILVEKNEKKLILVDIGTARLDDDRFLIGFIVKWAKKRQDKLLNFYIK